MAENSNGTTLPSSDIERTYGTSRFATIEIISTPSNTQLQVSRQWTVDGPTKAASLYEEPDGDCLPIVPTYLILIRLSQVPLFFST